jgi:hypothetical protein
VCLLVLIFTAADITSITLGAGLPVLSASARHRASSAAAIRCGGIGVDGLDLRLGSVAIAEDALSCCTACSTSWPASC